jgi:hypothetical protein
MTIDFPGSAETVPGAINASVLIPGQAAHGSGMMSPTCSEIIPPGVKVRGCRGSRTVGRHCLRHPRRSVPMR